jgi:ABC-type glycerol-3-phosphate transport system substrate-binding protein
MILAVIPSGCGGSNDTVKESTTSDTTKATTDHKETSGDTTETKKELEGTITINVQASPGMQEAWQAVADAYMKIHPKVKVIVDLKPSEGYAEWIKNMFGTENPSADIVNINLAGPAATDKSINFLEYAYNDSPYSNGVWKDQFNFEMQVKDLARNNWTAISLESVQVLWCYNKDIFAEVGVEPPKTWNELIEVCEKISKAGYQPIACPGDFNSFWAMQMGWLAQIYTDQTTRSMLEVYRAKEGDYLYDPAVDGSFKLDITDPFNDDSWRVNQNPVRAFKAIKDGVYKPDAEGMKTIMNCLKQVFPKYAGGDAFFGTKDALPLFYQGKAAMYIDGAWRLPQFKRDMDKIAAGEDVMSNDVKIEGVKKFNLGTFNMPSMEGPGIEAPARTIEVAVGFLGAVKKDKAHDDLVVDFLMYYSSKDGFSKYMSSGLEAGWVPNGPSLVYGVELPPEYASMFENLEFIGNVQKGYGVMMARGAPNDVQESLREWYNYTQEFLTDKITVDEWISKHKENVLKYLPESMKAAKISENDLKNPQNEPTGE